MRRERFGRRCTVCPKPPHRDFCPESNSILRDGVFVVLAALYAKCAVSWCELCCKMKVEDMDETGPFREFAIAGKMK